MKTFVPTPEQREKVMQLAADGVREDRIARRIGCDPKTLRKHFREELDSGITDSIAAVAGRLRQACEEGNVLAMIFFLKCRAGWNDKAGSIEQPGDITEVRYSWGPRQLNAPSPTSHGQVSGDSTSPDDDTGVIQVQ